MGSLGADSEIYLKEKTKMNTKHVFDKGQVRPFPTKHEKTHNLHYKTIEKMYRTKKRRSMVFMLGKVSDVE